MLLPKTSLSKISARAATHNSKRLDSAGIETLMDKDG
jgi:hypothetical protein